MTFRKKDYYTIVHQAQDAVPGFRDAFAKFIERVTIDQNSPSLITNYGRNMAQLALHFSRVPHLVSADEINSYLYQLTVHQKLSISYFKQTVYGLRYWFRLFDLDDRALVLPSIKKTAALPVVLSKQECKELFKAPRLLKHRYLLAFAYGAGLRMNELRLLKIADVDLHRKQVHVRLGKGKKDRYVVLADLLASKFQFYLAEVKPGLYLFDGILASRVKPKLKIQQMKMGIIVTPKTKHDRKVNTKLKMQFDVEACPRCKTGKMIRIHSFQANAPPTPKTPLRMNYKPVC